MIGVDPRPFTLRRLAQMAFGKWEFEANLLVGVLASAFNAEAAKQFRNPFDTRKEIPPTPEEIAEREAAISRKAEAKARVHERQIQKSRGKSNGDRR